MKKIITKFVALSSAGLLLLASCKKDGTLVTSNGGKPGTLTSSTTTPVLDKTKISDTTTIIKFAFTAPDFGYNAAVTNSLQIDSAGDNWAKPITVSLSTRVYSQGYSTSAFNAMLLKLNLKAGIASKVNVRIVHSLSSYVTPVYSNVLSLTVTPFNLTSWVYVPGAYEGWSNPGAGEDSLVSVTGNGIYTGIINFTAGNNQFLIVPEKNWTNKYATAQSAATGNSVSYAVTYNGANNFYAPATPGYYVVTLNVNTNVLTISPADYYSVIGDAAQGWSTDVPMKYINDGNQNWTATLPLVTTGSFKFRQDDAWTWSWGIPKTSADAGYGIPNTLNDTNNNNISITTNGNYTVTFNQGITLFGTTPTVTATYTITP